MKNWLTAIVLGLVTATPALSEIEWPDCYCTDSAGTRVELGQTICMYVDGRSFTARCEMSLNNPMWREVEDSCMTSENGLPHSPDPSLDTGFVNTEVLASET